MPNITSKFLSHVRTRLLNMTWSNLRFHVWRSFVAMATNLPSCFFNQFLEQLLKFLLNFTLLKCGKSHGFLITKELIFGFQKGYSGTLTTWTTYFQISKNVVVCSAKWKCSAFVWLQHLFVMIVSFNPPTKIGREVAYIWKPSLFIPPQTKLINID